MYFKITYLICFGLLLTLTPAPGQNTVQGKVLFPTLKKVVSQGSGYNKDGSPVMHSDDPMALPERNTIISLHPLSFTAEFSPTTDAKITQKEQTFLPYVIPVTKGTTVYFLNEDEFFHNIYSLTPGSRFNIGRRPPGSPYPIRIKRAGLLKLSCDIHPHMQGFILSLETPYFTRVDEKGEFHISDLPDGEYRLDVFYPPGKKKSLSLTLSGGQTWEKSIDLTERSRP